MCKFHIPHVEGMHEVLKDMEILGMVYFLITIKSRNQETEKP